MNIFLKAKAWQLSLLTAIPLVIHQAVFLGLMFNKGSHQTPMSLDENIAFTIMMMRYKPLSFLVSIIMIGWLWSAAFAVNNLIPEEERLNMKTFKLGLIYNVAYITILWLLIPLFMPADIYRIIFYYITPFNLVFMASMVYSIYIVSKSINTVDRKRSVSFGDFAGDFFLILFYPIGIWIIQPRIQKQIKQL